MQRQAMMREEREQRLGHNADKMLEVIHISYHKKSEMQIHLLMQYLSILKTQLPSMPHHHLSTVLFSPSHENLLLMGHNQLLAGLTFYRIQGKRAFELSLMAASESSKGYGAMLVNHLKSTCHFMQLWRKYGRLALLPRMPMIARLASTKKWAFRLFSTLRIRYWERRSSVTARSCRLESVPRLIMGN